MCVTKSKMDNNGLILLFGPSTDGHWWNGHRIPDMKNESKRDRDSCNLMKIEDTKTTSNTLLESIMQGSIGSS